MSAQPSHSVNTAPSPRNFTELWDEALRRYKDETGKDLLDLPTAQAFPSNPRNAEEIMTLFEKQGDAFDAFRDSGNKVRGILRSIVDGVLLIKDCAEGASVSPTVYTFASVTALTKSRLDRTLYRAVRSYSAPSE